MWFIIIAAFSHGQPLTSYSDRQATWSFHTRAECLDTVRQRAAALRAGGIHGRYMCMSSGMPDDELARQPKFEF